MPKEKHWKFRDLETVRPKEVGASRFFDLLRRDKKVLYDWGGGCITVTKEPDGVSKCTGYSMPDELFFEYVGSGFAGGGDIPLRLMVNGIEVEKIINIKDFSNFKSEGEAKEFLEESRKEAVAIRESW